MDNKKTFIVGENDVGLRLDKFIANNLPQFSRNEVQKFVIRDSLFVIRTKLSDKVKLNDEYTVEIPTETPVVCELRTQNSELRTLDILFEDEDIIVINKPRGMVMYPAPGNADGTLVQLVLAHTCLSSLGDVNRPGVVHRLDKDTSGAVILAKTDAAYRELVKKFAEHDLHRVYIAFVWGVPNWEGADISGNIGRSAKNRQKMTMLKYGGKPSKTHFDVMNVWPRENISQLKCTLFTGRTHQIRVHLSSHGFPVLCDPVYGRGTTRLGSVKNPELYGFLKGRNGQMLHAEVLDITHPITGEQMHFKARLAPDMQELKEILNS